MVVTNIRYEPLPVSTILLSDIKGSRAVLVTFQTFDQSNEETIDK